MMTNTNNEITIEYGTVANERGADYGFLPVYWVNGCRYGSTYAARGFDAETALERARIDALEEGARFVGDWSVSVTEKTGV